MAAPLTRHPWTPEEDERLRELAGRPITEITVALGRTWAAVMNRLGKLGLRREKEPPWTATDVDFLRGAFGRCSYAEIARQLGRSENAVKVKAMRLGLRQRRRQDLTPSQIGRMLCTCSKRVKGWIRKGWLPARLAPVPGKKIHLVAREDLVAFLRAHPEEWDARQCPDLHLRLGLRPRCRNPYPGQRPLWLKEKLAADQRRRRRGKRWTPDEDTELARLLRRGLTYKEVAVRLGRTEVAIDHRVHRLGQRLWELIRPWAV